MPVFVQSKEWAVRDGMMSFKKASYWPHPGTCEHGPSLEIESLKI